MQAGWMHDSPCALNVYLINEQTFLNRYTDYSLPSQQ